MKRSRHIQIYLKPGIREDDQMLNIWEACKRYDRPQDVFRAMLRAGMRAMVQSGEMPYAVVEECNLDAFVDKWLARQPAAQPKHQAAPVVFERHPLPVHAPSPQYTYEATERREPPPPIQPAPQALQPRAPEPVQRREAEKVAAPAPIITQPSAPSEKAPSGNGKRIGALM